MKQVKLEFNGSWVLKHRTDSKLPVELFVDAVSAKFDGNIKISKRTLTGCELILIDSNLSSEEIYTIVDDVLANEFNIDKDSEVASYTVNDIKEKETDESNAKEPDEKVKSKILDSLRSPHYISSVDISENPSADERINSLVGAGEFKAFLKELQLVAPQVVKHNTAEAFAFQNYLFSINKGCGLTTYLQLFAEVLASSGLFKFSGDNPVVEEKLLPPGNDSFDSVLSILKGFGRSAGKMICIDISEWMSHLSDKRMRDFLSVLEDQSAKSIIVFRIPFVETDVLNDIGSSLSDILFVRTISFPPMSVEELVECGKVTLKKFSYSADNESWELFKRRIVEEKSDGRFYGINTVNKVIHEMIYHKQLFDAKNNADSDIISSEELNGLVSTSGVENEGIAELGKMIGMENIRKNVDEIITQIELAKANRNLSNPCLHMRFVGNPGTGKTTVARLIGQILKERGVLRNGNFFEYSGRDFCGRYVGETAPKTASMCRDAYGSVMFIDEAYSLYRGDNDSRDYGREALDTLIAEMENHRDDFVVIMAGYPDEMEQLMDGNAGLESRMPYEIVFPNYSREQLYQIFMNMVENSVTCEKTLGEAVKSYFDSLTDDFISSKKFSNARFVRNLFERTCAKAGLRSRLNSSEVLLLTKEDFNLATSDRAFEKLLECKKKNRIGFIS